MIGKARQVTETLVVSQRCLAERVSRWDMNRWAIWRIADILECPDDSVPRLFYAQTALDAIEMIEAFERIMDSQQAIKEQS